MSPPEMLFTSVSMAALKSFRSGFLVIRRIVPARELAPYSVPCGPARSSTRSMS